MMIFILCSEHCFTCLLVYSVIFSLSLGFLFCVLLQNGWCLWVEGRSDSVQQADWSLIVQLDFAGQSWSGYDLVLVQGTVVFWLFIYSQRYFLFLLALCYWYTDRHSKYKLYMYVQTVNTLPLCPLPVFFAALNSSLLPSFILCCSLSSFLSPLCFFRTGFVPLVSSSGFILQPLFILPEAPEKSSEKTTRKKTFLIDKSAEISGRPPALSSYRTDSFCKVNQSTTHTSLNWSLFLPSMIFCFYSPHNHSDLW